MGFGIGLVIGVGIGVALVVGIQFIKNGLSF